MAFAGLMRATMTFFKSGAGRTAASGAASDAATSAVADEVNEFVTKKVDDAKDGLKQSITEGAVIVREEIIKAIRESNSVASGALLQSVTATGMTGSTEQPSITVGSSSFYARFVEEGIRPGGKQPPKEKIMEWMISKGMEPSESGAYLIGRKIKERGVEGKYPFRTGIDRARPLVDENARIVIEKSLEKD